MPRSRLALLVVAAVVAGCGAKEPAAAPKSTASPARTPAPAEPAIVGRWELERTCAQMVRALERAGLRPLAPGVVGDYFPGRSPRQLARKANLCAGAKPQTHAHFFTGDGAFGSLDERGEQVDDGSYRLVGRSMLRLGSGAEAEDFRFRVAGGDRLTLTPVIAKRAKRAALAKPLAFSLAGHQAAVAVTGQVFRRVPCGEWC